MTHSLFDDKRWTGQFFPPNNHEERFSGELTASFERGIELSYFVIGPQGPPDCAALHGVLASGDRCTLLGDFPLGRPGFRLRQGQATTYGYSGFSFLIVGGLFNNEDAFRTISFNMPGLKDFFGAKGFEDYIKVTNEPIHSLKTHFGRLEVCYAANFSPAPNDITSIIHSSDIEAAAALAKKFAEVEEQFPNANFIIKKEVSYRFVLHFDSPEKINAAFDYVVAISDLFSILSYEPVFPTEIKLTSEDNNKNLGYDLYPSMLASKTTLEMCEKSYQSGGLPITSKDFSLEQILEGWLSAADDYHVIISSVRGQTGLTNLHQTYGEIVLHATQLEAISHEAFVDNKKKYEYPVGKYASPRVRDTLFKMFETECLSNIGIAIADIRNDMAHVTRKKKWLGKLTLEHLIRLSQCLEMIVLSYVMEKIGISQETTFKYQDWIIPRPPTSN